MADSFRYTRGMIVLHWLTALLIAAAWLGAQGIDWFPRDQRPPVVSLHMLAGIAVGVSLLARAVLRFGGQTRLPPLAPGLLERVGHATHILLYLLMAAVVLAGLTNAWARGESFFGLLSLAPYAPTDRALRRTIGGLHELAANAILVVAGLHATAALFHHYVLRDTVLRRMLPSG